MASFTCTVCFCPVICVVHVLITVQALYLKNNGLKSLPSSIFKLCTELSILDLHGTEITMDVLRQVFNFLLHHVVTYFGLPLTISKPHSLKDGKILMREDARNIRSNWSSEWSAQPNLMKELIKADRPEHWRLVNEMNSSSIYQKFAILSWYSENVWRSSKKTNENFWRDFIFTRKIN